MSHQTIITSNAAFTPFNIMKFVHAIRSANAIAKQRRTLASLSAAQLCDIGITPAQRHAECKSRFWQDS